MTEGGDDKVILFPTTTVRERARRGPRAVSCVISSHYLLFGKVGSPVAFGTPIEIDVMAEPEPGKPPRRRARMTVALEEVIRAISAATGLPEVPIHALRAEDSYEPPTIEVEELTEAQIDLMHGLGDPPEVERDMLKFYIEPSDAERAEGKGGHIANTPCPVVLYRGRYRRIMPNGSMDVVRIHPKGVD